MVEVRSVIATPGRIEVELQLESGTASLELKSGPTLKRQTIVDVRDSHHHWSVRQRRLFCDQDEVVLPVSESSLFALDHEQMMQRLSTQVPSYVSSARVVNILQFSELIASTKVMGLRDNH